MYASAAIKSEISSSSGVRRIEALTGLNAIKYMQLNRSYIDQIISTLKIPIEAINERLISLINDKKSLSLKIEKLKKNIPSLQNKNDKSNYLKVINGISFVVNKLCYCNHIIIIYRTASPLHPVSLFAITYRHPVSLFKGHLH